MTGRVKVDRLPLYDIANEDFKISARMVTHACIRDIRAELIRRTELEIDKKDLNAAEMQSVSACLLSSISYDPKPPGHLASMRAADDFKTIRRRQAELYPVSAPQSGSVDAPDQEHRGRRLCDCGFGSAAIAGGELLCNGNCLHHVK
jgi:hypothetical protein